MTNIPTNVGGQQPQQQPQQPQQPFDAKDATPQGPMKQIRRPISSGQITPGTLIRFQYSLWKHDPNPLLIVTDRMRDGDIRGVNLRYLTLNYVVQLVRAYCGNQGFSFRSISVNQLFVNSFRRYKSFGMRNIEMLDCDLILKTIDIVRTQDPNQEKAMREAAQKQLSRQVNPQAKEFVTGTVPGLTPQRAIGPSPQQPGQNMNEG